MTDADLTERLAPSTTRRERTRAATVAEIKQTALGLMRENSTIDVRFADIARAMGLTAPALYRYFADRDELLTALIAEGFIDLGAALAGAMESIPDHEIGQRLLALARAYRRWASDDPHRFALIFGLPIPGYSAPQEGPTVDAASRAMSNLGSIVVDAMRIGVARAPLIAEVGPALRRGFKGKPLPGEPIPPERHQAMLQAWAALHGFVSLETNGQFHSFDDQARDELFVSLVRTTAVAIGLPGPPA